MPDDNPVKKTLKKLQTTAKTTRLALTPVGKSPEERLGELFRLVQLGHIHADGKTFVDQVPTKQWRSIVKAYEKESKAPDFDLAAFVAAHFTEYITATNQPVHEPTDDPEAHIASLWDGLTKTASKPTGSLIPLPHPYVVPGGRFQEQFYWDSYFIMLGLEASGRHDLTNSIMANIAHLFRKFGFIPTGNRTYFTSRSQPPYYLQMIRLISHRKGRHRYLIPRLPYLLQEYAFWTKESKAFLTMKHRRYHRNVRMPDGSTLQRYYDAKDTPRPESYKEDVETASLSDNTPENTYRHLRAGAESGWDYSSRWLADPTRLETIRTTTIVPIDLNCLLYELEVALAEAHRKLLQAPLARYYQKKADARRAAINAYLWDEDRGFFFDYHSPSETRTDVWSLAGVYPLYCGLATPDQAARVAKVIEEQFLRAGGVVTTLHDTGQQWDAPNGWAPLQWTTIIALRRYGFHELANTIKERWLAGNLALFQNENKFVEKYNVLDPTEKGGGGEYLLQDGFGWTNGVFLALRHDLDIELASKI